MCAATFDESTSPGSEAEGGVGVGGNPDITNRCPSPKGSSHQNPPGQDGAVGPRRKGRGGERCGASPVCKPEKPNTRKLSPSRSCQPWRPTAAVRPPHLGPSPSPASRPWLKSTVAPTPRAASWSQGPPIRQQGQQLEGAGRWAGPRGGMGSTHQRGGCGPRPAPAPQCPGG